MKKYLFQQFENGIVASAGQKMSLEGFAWNKHKDFKGVAIKNIITANQTEGLFTCHLVQIEPEHRIGLHTHPDSIELHEVIQGSGVCFAGEKEIRYTPGMVSVIARETLHEVRAGKEGLFLFAKFIIVPV